MEEDAGPAGVLREGTPARELLQALVELPGTIVIVTDARGAITYAGPRATELLGVEPSSLEGLLLSAVVHPDDVLDGDAPRGSIRLRAHDGSWRWFDASIGARGQAATSAAMCCC